MRRIPTGRGAAMAAAFLAVLACAHPAAAQSEPVPPPAAGWLVPPVDGAIARPYLNPLGPFAAGHRGIDYAVAAGTLVRAAGDGRVTFAGPVAGVRAVSIDHGGGLTTTYTSLGSTLVAASDEVRQGEWLGRSGFPHAGAAAGLHFGVKLDGEYVDPSAYLGPVGIVGAVHLAPLPTPQPPIPTSSLRAAVDALALRSSCREPAPIDDPPPPNRNIAVALAGIATHTDGGAEPEIYESFPELLGYPRAAIRHFSYRGAGGPSLHEPYERTDTYGDLRVAAEHLRELLIRVARESPGRHVDLIAHSQGGLVARFYLESLHDAWDPRLPVVDHLVTLSTPHQGAPLATAAASLGEHSITGAPLMRLVSALSRSGAPWLDPLSVAAGQLAPGSDLLGGLAREDVSLGTRVLALGAADDAAVPADRALIENEISRVMGPTGLNGHSGIVTAPQSLDTAYAFLRDARPPCPTGWDVWGPRVGSAAGWLEERIPSLYARIERAVIRRALFGVGELVERKG